MINGHVTNECPEAKFGIIRLTMNGRYDFAKVFQRFPGQIVIAKRNVEIHVSGRFNIALGTWTYRAELDFSAIETKCPSHER